uniref:Uncharacterized protein n=1 Tax=Graphocephala atropunctata TaxID=36148 RepID=A0A1B6MVF1_9HEMI
MGKKKNSGKKAPPIQKQETSNEQSNGEKRFVNLLHSYTIYKQKLRRLTKEDFENMLCKACPGTKAAFKLCTELMNAKQVSTEVPLSFEENVGFLSVPRLMPLLALLAERAEYNIKPSLSCNLRYIKTPQRFQDKFACLLVYGFWFLGRVITDSLSVKDQVNRGNMFNFVKGDLGFWWAGVKLLDWNNYAQTEEDPVDCLSFMKLDPPKYRYYSDRAIINMHKHPLYFLSDFDWHNCMMVIQVVTHTKVLEDMNSTVTDNESFSLQESSLGSPLCDDNDNDWDVASSITSELSLNSLASRESID